MNNFISQEEIKKSLLLSSIDYNTGTISLEDLWQNFLKLLDTLKISLQEIQDIQAVKNATRGDFSRQIMMEYILIPLQSPLAIRYFLSSNNIFSGTQVVENSTYYKFLTQKIIRSHIPKLTLCFNEPFVIEDPLLPIAKVFIATHEQFLYGMKFKLIEESKEVFYTKNTEELQEELGDVYMVIEHLKNIEKIKNLS